MRISDWSSDVCSSDLGYSIYRKRSFIRFDNIALGYKVPQQFLERYQVQQLKFFFNIRNVGIWSPHWDYLDPEWDPDIGTGPTPRTLTLGIDLTLYWLHYILNIMKISYTKARKRTRLKSSH